MNPALFLADLEAKPAALRVLAAELPRAWAAVTPRRRVVFLGMGSSRYAALVAARHLRLRGVDAVAEYASDDPPVFDPSETLLVAISASGTSRETLDAVAGRSYVAVTNDPASPLARGATTVVPMHAGVETGGVACRSFQHTQLLLDALTRHLTGEDTAGTVRLATLTTEATIDLLERRDAWLPRVAELLDGGDGVFPIAPVDRISSALQSALMFREGPRRAADGCETGDWAHVDVYLTKTLRYRALFFPGSRYDEQALDWMRQRNSIVVSVGDDVPNASGTVHFRHDDVPGVRLMTETLVAELVSARWWAETV